MTFPAFGVDASEIAKRFRGNQFSDISTSVDRWIQQAAGEIAGLLRSQGVEASEVDDSMALYAACQKYIEFSVCDDVARAMTRQDPDAAKAARMERDRLHAVIRSNIVGLLGETFNREEHLGSFAPVATRRRTGASSGNCGWKSNQKW